MRMSSSVLILVFMSFVMGTSEFMVMGILPDMADGLGVQYSSIGAIVSAFALSYAVCTPILSAVFGRFGRYRMFMVMAVLFLAADVWTLLSPNYISVLMSRVTTAAVSGALLSLSLSFVADLADNRARASAVAWVYAGFNISSIIGVPLGTFMSNAIGWRSVFVLILILGVVVVTAAAIRLPRDAGVTKVNKSGRDAIGLMKDMRVIGGFCVTAFAAAGMYAVYTYITPILEDELMFPDDMVGIGIMAYGVMCLFSNLIAGKLAEHGGLRKVRYLLVVQALVLFALPMALSSQVAGFTDLMLAGLMMYLMNSSVQLLMMDVAVKEHPSTITLASSLNPTAFNIGITFGSLLAGVIYDASGATYLGYGAGIFVLISAAFAFSLCVYCRRPGKSTSVT